MSLGSLLGLALRAGVQVGNKAQGDPRGRDVEAAVGLERRQRFVMRPEALAAYEANTGLAGTGLGSLLWLETPFFDLMGHLTSSRAFPFSAFGQIHLRQVLEQPAPVEPVGPVDLCCRLEALRPTDKGWENDFSMAVDRDGQRLWSGMATLLSRGPRSGGSRARPEPVAAPADAPRLLAPAGTGVAYAKVSGDWNPHHLWAWTARPLGYKRPIAQGMWTLAKALGLLGLDGHGASRVDATWKLPLLLPGEAAVLRDGDGFSVIDAATSAPYVVGTAQIG